MSLVPTKTFEGHQNNVFSLVVWNDLLYSGSSDKTIKQWNHEGVCLQTFEGHQDTVYSLVVWNDLLYSGSEDGEIRQWNHDGVCLKTFDAGSAVNSLVVWNHLLYSGSDDCTIIQWVNEEAERVKQQRQQDMRNLLLVYSRSIPELNEDIAKEIATYF